MASTKNDVISMLTQQYTHIKARCWKPPGHYSCSPEPGRPDCVIPIEIGVNGDALPATVIQKVTKNLTVSFYSPMPGFKYISLERYHPVVSIMLRFIDQIKSFGQNFCCREVKIYKHFRMTYRNLLSYAKTFQNEFDNKRSVRMKHIS